MPTDRPIPDALAVERLALNMAAAVGLVWARTEDEQRTRLRIQANSVLLHLGIEALAAAPNHLHGVVFEAAEALRSAAAIADHHKERDTTAARFVRCAVNLETLAQIMIHAEPDEAV